MSDTKAQQEPSMEEILASIRRIISEDNDLDGRPAPEPEPAPAAPPPQPRAPEPPPVAVAPEPLEEEEDVLELTQMVKDDGSVIDVDDDWAPSAQPDEDADPLPGDDFESVFARQLAEPEPEPARARPNASSGLLDDEEDLVSPPAAEAASAAFAQLASSIGQQGIGLYAGGPTIEQIIKELLRPMLKTWLDQNLPPMVERMVEREIEKMVRRGRGL